MVYLKIFAMHFVDESVINKYVLLTRKKEEYLYILMLDSRKIYLTIVCSDNERV